MITEEMWKLICLWLIGFKEKKKNIFSYIQI